MNLASMQQGIKKLQWFEYFKVVFLEILNAGLRQVFANQVTYSPGSYHIVRKILKRVAPVCSTKHMFVNYCYKGSQASQVEL